MGKREARRLPSSHRENERKEIEEEKLSTLEMEKRLAALNARLEIIKRRKQARSGS